MVSTLNQTKIILYLRYGYIDNTVYIKYIGMYLVSKGKYEKKNECNGNNVYAQKCSSSSLTI